jgi:hypothetical protein
MVGGGVCVECANSTCGNKKFNSASSNTSGVPPPGGESAGGESTV